MGGPAAYFLLAEPHWVKRHVETLDIVDNVSARRQLTVDLVLPADSSARIGQHGTQAVFLLPITYIAKDLQTSFIDFRDEDGRALSLLTRSENAGVTAAALKGAAHSLLGKEPEGSIAGFLEDIAARDPGEAQLTAAVVLFLSSERQVLPTAHPAWPRFERLLIELSGNSAVWLPLVGCPGERRIVKFAYEASWGTRPPVRERAAYTVELDGEPTTFIAEPVAVPRGSRARRAVRLAATRMGWWAIEFEVPRPAARDADSYHLQVHAPDGLDATGVRMEAVLLDAAGEPVTPRTLLRPRSASVYCAGVTTAERQPGRDNPRAVVAMRAGASGPLGLSLLACGFISGLIWGYALSAARAVREPEVGAAVLLVAPALLAALAVRPGEHPVAARVLSGVRFCVVIAGLLAAAAAAALAGVHPSAWSIEQSWEIYAVASLVPLALLLISCGVALPWPAPRPFSARRLLGQAVAVAVLSALALRVERADRADLWVAAFAVLAGLGLLLVRRAGRLAAGAARQALVLWLLALVAVLVGASLVVLGAWPGGASQADALTAAEQQAWSLAAAFAIALALAARAARASDGAATPLST